MSKKSKSKSYKIPSAFQNFLSEEELEVYEEYFNTESSKAIREKLVSLFQKKLDASLLKSDKENKYEMPAWSEYQADACGYRRAMRELISFLK